MSLASMLLISLTFMTIKATLISDRAAIPETMVVEGKLTKFKVGQEVGERKLFSAY